MSGGYPPGAKNDPRAPYNQPPPEVCPECENDIYGPESHEEDCPIEGREPYEIEEDRRAAAQEAKYDAAKEDGRL